jgi:hypothetical protein
MEKKIIRILQVLDRANCCCPLGYITLHTNIVDPLKMLESLEREGYVRRAEYDEWSPSGHPQFEITQKARQELRRLQSIVFKTPLKVMAQTLIQKIN